VNAVLSEVNAAEQAFVMGALMVFRNHAAMADTLTAAQASGTGWRTRAIAAEQRVATLARELDELRETAREELQHAHERATRAEQERDAAIAAVAEVFDHCTGDRDGAPCDGTALPDGGGLCSWCFGEGNKIALDVEGPPAP
jgi:hypothetical protein